MGNVICHVGPLLLCKHITCSASLSSTQFITFADVLFHLFVMLSVSDVKFESVLQELERREGKSGLVEKSERKKK